MGVGPDHEPDAGRTSARSASGRATDLGDALLDRARDAADRAYAPYSRLHVGAALETTTGEVVTACNVENASYGLTSCAERNAVFVAVARFGPAMRVARLAVAARYADGRVRPISPCGACRQVISELASPECEIVYVTETGVVRRTLAGLLPDGFGASNLPVSAT